MASLPARADARIASLDKQARVRIAALALQVDNVHVPVQYRAPVAELEQFALGLCAELEHERTELERLRGHLRSLEWAAVPEPHRVTARCCPVGECGVIFTGLHPPRHAPDCWLAEACGLPRDRERPGAAGEADAAEPPPF